MTIILQHIESVTFNIIEKLHFLDTMIFLYLPHKSMEDGNYYIIMMTSLHDQEQ